ncbi:MAG: uroporphyrinogen-III synthase, partial [Phycisphaerae bacterium]|nr:uroporphyrinogen-III synthase [Phycisphaerae bacterium]
GRKTLPARARAARLAAPAVLIVGPTAAQPQPAAAASPLAGQTVLVTRPPAQAQELVERFADAGARVCLAPAISIAPPASYDALDAAVADLGAFDWLAATSVNGVAAVFARLAATGRDARALGGVAVAAVGPATADALAERGIRADLVAEPHTTSALAKALERQGLTGRRVLLPRADIAPPELADRLAAAGADVTEVAAYRTLRAAALPDDAVVELRAGRIDWITATSASCATNLAALAREAGIDLTGVKLAAIGPVTNRALRAAGLNAAVVADLHTTDGLVGAMVRFSNCQGPSDAPAQAGGA